MTDEKPLNKKFVKYIDDFVDALLSDDINIVYDATEIDKDFLLSLSEQDKQYLRHILEKHLDKDSISYIYLWITNQYNSIKDLPIDKIDNLFILLANGHLFYTTLKNKEKAFEYFTKASNNKLDQGFGKIELADMTMRGYNHGTKEEALKILRYYERIGYTNAGYYLATHEFTGDINNVKNRLSLFINRFNSTHYISLTHSLDQIYQIIKDDPRYNLYAHLISNKLSNSHKKEIDSLTKKVDELKSTITELQNELYAPDGLGALIAEKTFNDSLKKI